MGVQDQEVISLWSKEEEENRRRFKNEERTNQATVQVEICYGASIAHFQAGVVIILPRKKIKNKIWLFIIVFMVSIEMESIFAWKNWRAVRVWKANNIWQRFR